MANFWSVHSLPITHFIVLFYYLLIHHNSSGINPWENVSLSPFYRVHAPIESSLQALQVKTIDPPTPLPLDLSPTHRNRAPQDVGNFRRLVTNSYPLEMVNNHVSFNNQCPLTACNWILMLSGTIYLIFSSWNPIEDTDFLTRSHNQSNTEQDNSIIASGYRSTYSY